MFQFLIAGKTYQLSIENAILFERQFLRFQLTLSTTCIWTMGVVFKK